MQDPMEQAAKKASKMSLKRRRAPEAEGERPESAEVPLLPSLTERPSPQGHPIPRAKKVACIEDRQPSKPAVSEPIIIDVEDTFSSTEEDQHSMAAEAPPAKESHASAKVETTAASSPCLLCGKNLFGFSNVEKQVHVNQCLDGKDARNSGGSSSVEGASSRIEALISTGSRRGGRGKSVGAAPKSVQQDQMLLARALSASLMPAAPPPAISRPIEAEGQLVRRLQQLDEQIKSLSKEKEMLHQKLRGQRRKLEELEVEANTEVLRPSQDSHPERESEGEQVASALFRTDNSLANEEEETPSSSTSQPQQRRRSNLWDVSSGEGEASAFYTSAFASFSASTIDTAKGTSEAAHVESKDKKQEEDSSKNVDEGGSDLLSPMNMSIENDCGYDGELRDVDSWVSERIARLDGLDSEQTSAALDEAKRSLARSEELTGALKVLVGAMEQRLSGTSDLHDELDDDSVIVLDDEPPDAPSIPPIRNETPPKSARGTIDTSSPIHHRLFSEECEEDHFSPFNTDTPPHAPTPQSSYSSPLPFSPINNPSAPSPSGVPSQSKSSQSSAVARSYDNEVDVLSETRRHLYKTIPTACDSSRDIVDVCTTEKKTARRTYTVAETVDVCTTVKKPARRTSSSARSVELNGSMAYSDNDSDASDVELKVCSPPPLPPLRVRLGNLGKEPAARSDESDDFWTVNLSQRHNDRTTAVSGIERSSVTSSPPRMYTAEAEDTDAEVTGSSSMVTSPVKASTAESNFSREWNLSQTQPSSQGTDSIGPAVRNGGSVSVAANMPKYDDMSERELKTAMSAYGMKPKSSKQMILKLKEIWVSLHSDCQAPLPASYEGGGSLSQQSNTSNTTNVSKKGKEPATRTASAGVRGRKGPPSPSTIQAAIKSNGPLYEQLLCFEAVDLSTVAAAVASAGVKCSKNDLRSYLDDQGVTFLVADKGSGASRRRPPRHPK